VTNWQILSTVAAKVVLICGPLCLAAAALAHWKFDRPKNKDAPSRDERAAGRPE
jgi:hypothetical protein